MEAKIFENKLFSYSQILVLSIGLTVKEKQDREKTGPKKLNPWANSNIITFNERLSDFDMETWLNIVSISQYNILNLATQPLH